MAEGPVGQSADLSSYPIFSVSDIGGVPGLGRWIRLCGSYPRAVAPIFNRVRREKPSVEVRVLEMASAIEYWVAAHRKTTAWAKRGSNFAEALALHVGSPFRNWVGDPQKWAQKFWKGYSGLKHDPAYQYSARELGFISEVAHYLLVADLLNRVAGTKQPSRKIFLDYRLDRLGRQIQHILNP